MATMTEDQKSEIRTQDQIEASLDRKESEEKCADDAAETKSTRSDDEESAVPSYNQQRRTSQVDIGPPPDGGFFAWTQVILVHLVVLSSWGYVTSYGVFQSMVLVLEEKKKKK